MPIQFRCAQCGQPIEVDDEFADDSVLCPFCRQVVTAPRASTLSHGVTPGADTDVGQPPVMAPPPVAPIPRSGSRRVLSRQLAAWAMMATCVGFLMNILARLLLLFFIEEFGPQPDPLDLAERLLPFITDNGYSFRFVFGMEAACVGSLSLATGFIVAIVAAVRQDDTSRTPLVFVALLVSVVLPLLLWRVAA